MVTAARTAARRAARTGRTFGYIRISDDREGRKAGVDRQRKTVGKLSDELGLGEPEIIEDNDFSASKYARKPRPGYDRLLTLIAAGEVSDLLIWHNDRLIRQNIEFERLVPLLIAHDVRVHSVRGGRIDLGTADGRKAARDLATAAAYESEHRSERVTEATAERAAEGRYSGGGRRPYGWRFGDDPGHLVAVEREQAVVRELTDAVVDDRASCASLAGRLRDRGEPTVVRYRTATWPAGGKVPLRKPHWTAEGVRAVVLRAMNAGLVEHTETVDGQPVTTLYPAVWAPVVPRERWEAAVGILTAPQRDVIGTDGRTRRAGGRPPGNSVSTLLSGIARCPDGHPFRSDGVHHGYRAYKCKTSPDNRDHLTRQADRCDDRVIALVCAALAREPVAITTRPPDRPDLAGQIAGLESRVEQHEDALSGYPTPDLDGVSPAGLRRNLARLRADVAELRRQAAVTVVPPVLHGLGDITPATFQALPLDRQRAIVAAVVTVVIHPAPRGARFVAELVVVTPKAAG